MTDYLFFLTILSEGPGELMVEEIFEDGDLVSLVSEE